MPARPNKTSRDHITEVAMAIAEEVAALSRARQPIAIDEALMLASLDPGAVVELHAWLQALYDWQDEKRLLFDEEITAEGLARDIVDSKPDVDVPPTPAVRIESCDQPTRSTSCPPASQASEGTFLDIGMAPYESWTGNRSRKASVIYGLLGLGLLGSPLSPSLQSPRSAVTLTSSSLDPRAPSSAYTPIFSPWLKALRIPGIEPLQSPWVPNAPHRSSDGLWAFPQSPRDYPC